MHIPLAMAKLGDRRAVPLLIKMIKEPVVVDNDDSDSSDELFTTGGTHRLTGECCLALSAFFSKTYFGERISLNFVFLS